MERIPVPQMGSKDIMDPRTREFLEKLRDLMGEYKVELYYLYSGDLVVLSSDAEVALGTTELDSNHLREFLEADHATT